MTKRERELAQRHLVELIDARDRAWRGVHRDGETAKYLLRYEAFKYAIGLVEAALATPDVMAETEAA